MTATIIPHADGTISCGNVTYLRKCAPLEILELIVIDPDDDELRSLAYDINRAKIQALCGQVDAIIDAHTKPLSQEKPSRSKPLNRKKPCVKR